MAERKVRPSEERREPEEEPSSADRESQGPHRAAGAAPNVAKGAHSSGHTHQDRPDEYEGDSAGTAEPVWKDRFAGSAAPDRPASPRGETWDDSEREGGIGSLYREEFKLRGYGRSGYGKRKVPKVRDRHRDSRPAKAPSAPPRKTIRSSQEIAGRPTSSTAPRPGRRRKVVNEARPRARDMTVKPNPLRAVPPRSGLRFQKRRKKAKAPLPKKRAADAKSQFDRLHRIARKADRGTRVPRSSVYDTPESYRETSKGGPAGGGRGLEPSYPTKRKRTGPGRRARGGRWKATAKKKIARQRLPRRPGAMRQSNRGAVGQRRPR